MPLRVEPEPRRLRGDVFVSWSYPRSWRSHPLAPQPYWVEVEATVRVDDVAVDHLSWSHPLTAAERDEYAAALASKAAMLHGRW